MRVQPQSGVGKLGHIGAADEHGTGRPEAGDRRRVIGGGRGVFQYQRTRRRGLALNVEQVLHRYRQAGEWALPVFRSPQPVEGGRGLARSAIVDGYERPSALASGIESPREGFVDQCRARNGPGTKLC